MTLTSTAFASTSSTPSDLLRLVLVIGTALTVGLIVREVVLRWHDRSVLVIIAATVVLGGSPILVEVRSFGQPPTPRLVLCLVGLALVAGGLIRARALRRTVKAVVAEETQPVVTSYSVPGDRAIGVARTTHVPGTSLRPFPTKRPGQTRQAPGPVHMFQLR